MKKGDIGRKGSEERGEGHHASISHGKREREALLKRLVYHREKNYIFIPPERGGKREGRGMGRGGGRRHPLLFPSRGERTSFIFITGGKEEKEESRKKGKLLVELPARVGKEEEGGEKGRATLRAPRSEKGGKRKGKGTVKKRASLISTYRGEGGRGKKGGGFFEIPAKGGREKGTLQKCAWSFRKERGERGKSSPSKRFIGKKGGEGTRNKKKRKGPLIFSAKGGEKKKKKGNSTGSLFSRKGKREGEKGGKKSREIALFLGCNCPGGEEEKKKRVGLFLSVEGEKEWCIVGAGRWRGGRGGRSSASLLPGKEKKNQTNGKRFDILPGFKKREKGNPLCDSFFLGGGEGREEGKRKKGGLLKKKAIHIPRFCRKECFLSLKKRRGGGGARGKGSNFSNFLKGKKRKGPSFEQGKKKNLEPGLCFGKEEGRTIFLLRKEEGEK